jgi:hypothetical protein
MPEIREHPPLNTKMSTVAPLRGNAEDLGAPTTQRKNVDGGPPRRQCRESESAHHLMSESSMVVPQAPVGGSVSSQDPKSVL